MTEEIRRIFEVVLVFADNDYDSQATLNKKRNIRQYIWEK